MHGELRRLVLLVLRRARFVRFGPSGTLGPVGVCWCLFGVRVDVIRVRNLILPPRFYWFPASWEQGLTSELQPPWA